MASVCGQGRARRQFDREAGAAHVARGRELERHPGATRKIAAEEQRRADGEDLPAVLQAPAQRLQIAAHPERILVLVLVVLEQIGGHQRRQRPRHDQREGHGDAGRQGEGLEELADDARHEADRREDGDDGRGGGDDGQADLVGGLHRGVVGRLAVPHVADDVLDLDDGVIDQDADGQRQGQQGDARSATGSAAPARRRPGSATAAWPWR